MFTLKRALLVVFVIVAIGMDLTGAANIRGFGDYEPMPNASDPQRQTNSANDPGFKQLRSLLLSAVMIIIIILSRILACFENKNCQRAAVILNYLSTGVLVVMLYFIYNDIILSVH
eukprot:182278_1